MKQRSLALRLLIVLLLWKVVRTDWVVSTPYWFGDPAKTSTPGGDYSTYEIYPPISPLWSPPKPADVESGAASWESLYPGGGAWGITGDPVLRPSLLRIGLKLVGSFVLLYPLLLLTRWIIRRSDSVPALPT